MSKERLEEEYRTGKVVIREDGKLERRMFYDPNLGEKIGNLWCDIKPPTGDELTDYPTQKPIALLDRIIRASSGKGDTVFDPFCGCGTTMVVADRVDRNWVGIDMSSKAVELVKTRIQKHQRRLVEVVSRTDLPKRTDLGPIVLHRSLVNKRRLYGEQNGRCNGCRDPFAINYLTVDHIIARQSSGSDHIQNLQLLCSNCNRIKGTRGQEYLVAKLEGKSTRRYWKSLENSTKLSE